jgi:hypothetical protein
MICASHAGGSGDKRNSKKKKVVVVKPRETSLFRFSAWALE